MSNPLNLVSKLKLSKTQRFYYNALCILDAIFSSLAIIPALPVYAIRYFKKKFVIKVVTQYISTSEHRNLYARPSKKTFH